VLAVTLRSDGHTVEHVWTSSSVARLLEDGPRDGPARLLAEHGLAGTPAGPAECGAWQADLDDLAFQAPRLDPTGVVVPLRAG
jgi:hypothetical protein